MSMSLEELDDELTGLFEEFIEDNGIEGVRDILDILADNTGFIGEVSKDIGSDSGNDTEIRLGERLMRASARISRLAKKI